jgi:phosphoglycolate phosphatase
MGYRAVLFDLDGTLLDTLADLAESTNIALRRRGFPEHPFTDYRYMVGDGMRQLISRALPEERRDEATVDDCLRPF